MGSRGQESEEGPREEDKAKQTGRKCTFISIPGLDIRLVDSVARGASRFENSLAPQKLTGPPPKKTNWPLPQNQTCAMKKIFA